MLRHPPPPLDTDSHPVLKMDEKVKNIFLTQTEETATVSKVSHKTLAAGVKSLKKNLILKKQAEVNEVNVQLALKQHDFRSRMEALARRRSEVEIKQQQTKEKELKLEQFVAEKKVKRQRALKKCEATREQNISKQKELQDLTEQLRHLRNRENFLTVRIRKYKIFEDYLMKALDRLPNVYNETGYESLVTPIIRRHGTLSLTYEKLQRNLGLMEGEMEEHQRKLQTMIQEHSIRKLINGRELSELHSELQKLKENNKQNEVNLLRQEGVSRERVKEVAQLLMAVHSLAQLCYLPAYGPLESMSVLMMMDMVKEFILDKADTERRVKRLKEPSTASLTDKKQGLIKSIESKTLTQRSSKVNKKN